MPRPLPALNDKVLNQASVFVAALEDDELRQELILSVAENLQQRYRRTVLLPGEFCA